VDELVSKEEAAVKVDIEKLVGRDEVRLDTKLV